MKSVVYNRDCLEAMREMPSSNIGYVITSPPYNLSQCDGYKTLRAGHKGSSWKNGHKLAGGYDEWNDAMPYPEYVQWQNDVLNECWRLIDDRGAIFYNHKPRLTPQGLRMPTNLAKELPVRQIIIWHRQGVINYGVNFYAPAHEWIVVFAKKEFRLKSRSASVMSDVWAFSQETQSNHPAPFPLELPKRILSTVAPSEKPILDPFLGSGTTRLAAHDAGFNFIGIELSKAYFNAQEERFARHVAQGNLFIPSEPIAEQGSLLG